MVRGHGRDRIQVYARIVHQLTSERMKPILEHCVWGLPTRQQKEPFNAILTRPGSYKPSSELTVWYRNRFKGNGARAAKVGIVALARKLLIALWRFVETGLVPQGAELRAA